MSNDLFDDVETIVTHAARRQDFPKKHQELVDRLGYVLAEKVDGEARDALQDILSKLAEV